MPFLIFIDSGYIWNAIKHFVNIFPLTHGLIDYTESVRSHMPWTAVQKSLSLCKQHVNTSLLRSIIYV